MGRRRPGSITSWRLSTGDCACGRCPALEFVRGRLAHVHELSGVLRVYRSALGRLRVRGHAAGHIGTRLLARVAPLLDDHDGEPDDHAEDGGPDVGTQAEDDLARIDADGLPHDAARAVPDQVKAEEAAPLQLELASHPEQDEDTHDVPDHFVQERGVEERVRRKALGEGDVVGVDFESPRNVGRQTEQLTVEPVTEATHRLSEQQARGQSIRVRPESDAAPAATEPRTDRAADEGAVDRDAAFPDVEDGQGVRALAEVESGVRQHVVDPRRDDAEHHGRERHVKHDPRLRPPFGEAVVGQNRRGDDAGDDAQRVEVDPQRAELDETDRRARDARDDTRVHAQGERRHDRKSRSAWRRARFGSRPSWDDSSRTGRLAQERPVSGESPVLGRLADARGARGEGADDLAEAFHAAIAQRAYERRADDRAVGVLDDSRDLIRSRNPDAHARVLRAVFAEARDERASSGIQLGALARDAHRRHRVNETRRVRDHEVDALIGRGRCCEEDAVKARAGARGDPLPRGLRRDVRRDDARPARSEQVVGIAVDAVLPNRVPVRHDENRDVDTLGDRPDGREQILQTEARGQSGLRRFLDDNPVHDRIAVRRAQLDDVDTVLGQRDSRLDARLDVGKTDRQVPDEHSATLCMGARDRLFDA